LITLVTSISTLVMKKIIWLITFLQFSVFCHAQTPTDTIQKLKKYYHQKLKSIIQKDKKIANYLEINDFGVFLYSSEDKIKRKKEYFVSWKDFMNKPDSLYSNSIQNIENNAEVNIEKPLKGIKIALDPGHFAGNIQEARLEGKFLEFKLPDSTQIQFYESALAWATARILQKKLEQKGATVMLTRSQHYLTAFGITFKQWHENYLQEQKDLKKKPLPANQAIEYFKKMEFSQRNDLINDFKPNLTLIIHFNVEANNTAWKKTVSSNFCMAFVAGGLTSLEMATPEKRLNVLRLLLSKDIENSVSFSDKILQQHEKILNIPRIPIDNSQVYLKDYCLFSGVKGVYSRNLSLTRQVKGTLCYGESLFQDNEKEVQILNQKTLKVDDLLTSPRTEQVAEAYFQGILEYLKK
jgi:N-acetylmuramoyl-L-alanine amidase